MPITFTDGKISELRLKYNEAVQNGEKQFVFDNHDLLTAYAKYLLEYLESYNL
jgi:hypothetical protein